MIIPSIDLSRGKVVQWRRGREAILERADAEALARRFGRHGPVAVIDLDAALGTGDNTGLVARLCGIAPCRVGGGIRTEEKARRLIAAGADRLIIGTRAHPDFLSRFPRSKLLAALDEDEGELVDHGWRRKTGRTLLDRVRELSPYVSGFVYTTVDREGTLAGADMVRFRAAASTTSLPLTVAGGVSSMDEVLELERKGIDCQVGMALYAGKIDLTEAFLRCVCFDVDKGLVPCVVRDAAGRVRVQAWMNEEALDATLRTGKVHFWSRRRNSLWRKGESSGNELRAKTVRPDCDRDALLVVADAGGPTCHDGRLSCFSDEGFALVDLESALRGRLRDGQGDSWTRRLCASKRALRDKLLEEASELAEARGEGEIAHEAADLLYHLMVSLAREGVPFSRVLNELDSRRTWDLDEHEEGED